jgi:hypothetical protein
VRFARKFLRRSMIRKNTAVIVAPKKLARRNSPASKKILTKPGCFRENQRDVSFSVQCWLIGVQINFWF